MICHFCHKEIEGDNDIFCQVFINDAMFHVCETCGEVIEAILEEIDNRR